jgi:SAM-dependent methyltransferase
MSDTYANVDGAADVAWAIADQERIDGWPAIAAYKARMDELTAGAEPVLEVGAGPGLDAERMGAVAVDRSHAMARHAAARGVRVLIGDAHELPVRSAAFGVVRADRVLQHLADPLAALAELAAAVRPGGRVIVAEPDQQTLSITVPGAPERIVQAMRQLRRDVGYRNGCLVTTLPAELRRLGFGDVGIEAFPLVLEDPDDAFGIATWVHRWRANGFSAADDEEWRRHLEASRRNGFVYAVTYFVVSGTRP